MTALHPTPARLAPLLLATWLAACGGEGSDGGSVEPDGPTPTTLEACGAFEAGLNLNACTLSYLGDPEADTLSGVDLTADGTLVLGGALVTDPEGVAALPLEGGGEGVVLRLGPTGGALLSVTRLPGAVAELALGDDGAIAAVGGFGVALLSPDASALIWRQRVPEAHRVDVGSDGAVGVLADTTVAVYDATGEPLGRFDLSDDVVNDLAVYGPSRLVIVTGFNQVSGDLQQPFLRAYSYTGEVQWSAYDWSAEEASGPDTRGYAVSIGRDGMLYYAGESHGGGSSHSKDPGDLSAEAPIITFDAHNDPYNWNGSAPLAFYARFNPEDGTIERGQFIVPRLSSGKGNGSSPRFITATEDGTVLVGGGSACCIADGTSKTINGLHPMESYAGGAFLLIASPDFSERLAWTAVNASATHVELTGVAARGDAMTFVGAHGPDKDSGQVEGRILTTQALHFEPGGGESDGFFGVIPAP